MSGSLLNTQAVVSALQALIRILLSNRATLIAALTPPAQPALVFVEGAVTPGDGGGGFYYANTADSTSPDNGTTVIVTNTGLRYRYLDIKALPNGNVPGVFTNTQMNAPLVVSTNSLGAQTAYQLSHPGLFATLGVAVTMAVPSTSTVQEADAFASYSTNASPATGSVAASFYAYNLVDGTASFAMHPLADDQGHLSTIYGASFDIVASNAGSSAFGIRMLGEFPTGTPAAAIAYQVAALSSPWQFAFISFDGASQNFALIGATGTTANSNGQPIFLHAYDSSGVLRNCTIQTTYSAAGADLRLSTPNGSVITSGPFFAIGDVTANNNLAVGGRIDCFGVLDAHSQVIARSTLDCLGVLTAHGPVISNSDLDCFGVNPPFFHNSIKVNVNTGTPFLEVFYTGSSTVIGSITYDGTLVNYNTVSDARLKNDHGPIDNSGDLVEALEPKWFSWKDKPGIKLPGFFAQDTAAVYPWAVTEGKGEPDEDGFEPWQMDNAKLVPLLVAELKSLRKRVEYLETQYDRR